MINSILVLIIISLDMTFNISLIRRLNKHEIRMIEDEEALINVIRIYLRDKTGMTVEEIDKRVEELAKEKGVNKDE